MPAQIHVNRQSDKRRPRAHCDVRSSRTNVASQLVCDATVREPYTRKCPTLPIMIRHGRAAETRRPYNRCEKKPKTQVHISFLPPSPKRLVNILNHASGIGDKEQGERGQSRVSAGHRCRQHPSWSNSSTTRVRPAPSTYPWATLGASPETRVSRTRMESGVKKF
jgi:hypothetical protein